jgi:formate/nitrite transporter FocA (FNT family)
MTLFTWVAAASDGASARILASLIVGFLLMAPSLNHAVVGFGEIIFGIFAGTAQSDWGDLVRTVAIAIAGNLLGGVGLVFSTRLAQVRGEPDSDYGPGGAGSQPDGGRAADGDGNGKPADGARVPAGRH